MPEIGKPLTTTQSNLKNVGIRKVPEGQAGERELKQSIIESINGKKFNEVKIGTAEGQKVGKDEFLRMLTYQLQNQDPMNPMEENKFAAELAQFSQLEQLTNMNEKIDKLNEASKMERKFMAASFVGKKVVTSGNSVVLDEDGEKKNLLFSLNQNAKEVLLRVLDSQGNIANEIRLTNVPAGDHSHLWDGKQLDGFDTPKGEYSLYLKAWDDSYNEIKTSTKYEGLVSAVDFDGKDTVLHVDGKRVYLRDVDSFQMAKPKIKQDLSKIQAFQKQQQQKNIQ